MEGSITIQSLKETSNAIFLKSLILILKIWS